MKATVAVLSLILIIFFSNISFSFEGTVIEKSIPNQEVQGIFIPILDKWLTENWVQEAPYYVDEDTEGVVKQRLDRFTFVRVEIINKSILYTVDVYFYAEFFENEELVDKAKITQRLLFLVDNKGNILDWDPMAGYRIK